MLCTQPSGPPSSAASPSQVQDMEGSNSMPAGASARPATTAGQPAAIRPVARVLKCLDLCKRCGSSVSQYIQHCFDFARSFSSDD